MSSAPNIAEQGKLAVDSYKAPKERGQATPGWDPLKSGDDIAVKFGGHQH